MSLSKVIVDEFLGAGFAKRRQHEAILAVFEQHGIQ